MFPADSGVAAAPIVWQTYRDERVRLLGGRTLTVFTPVTDAGLLARLDEKASGRVRQLDLRALGIAYFGEMKSRGFGRAAASQSVSIKAGRPASPTPR